jgi:hypothetical protein
VGPGIVAFIVCLVLVGLPPARVYSDPGWPLGLASATLVLAAAGWWRARNAASVPVAPGEVALLIIGGALLTAGFVGGSFGYAAHLPLIEGVRQNTAIAQPLQRPLESAPAFALTGGPRELAADPLGVTFHRGGDRGDGPRPVAVTASVLPGWRADISSRWQGTELESSDETVVVAEADGAGGWQLRPQGPGNAIVTVRNRRSATWIGAWVLADGRSPPVPPLDVSAAVRVEAGPTRPPAPGQGFANTQVVTVRNVSHSPILGPLYLVLQVAPEQARLVGPQTTGHPALLEAFAAQPLTTEIPDRLPVFEVLPGSGGPRNYARVLGPGESVAVVIRVAGRIDLDRAGTSARVFRTYQPISTP